MDADGRSIVPVTCSMGTMGIGLQHWQMNWQRGRDTIPAMAMKGKNRISNAASNAEQSSWTKAGGDIGRVVEGGDDGGIDADIDEDV
jgi:hypothetical protein